MKTVTLEPSYLSSAIEENMRECAIGGCLVGRIPRSAQVLVRLGDFDLRNRLREFNDLAQHTSSEMPAYKQRRITTVSHWSNAA